MSKVEDIIDALENKLSKILHRNEVLKQTNGKLTLQLNEQKQKLKEQEDFIAAWADKYETLKIAKSMLGNGSDDIKRETKLKINALIRDIDHCIGQLAE